MSLYLQSSNAQGKQPLRRPLPAALQCGQALAEGLVVITVLATFWLALGWLGRLQDIGLSAQHASSLTAFLFTRSPALNNQKAVKEQAVARHFDGPAHQWRDLQG